MNDSLDSIKIGFFGSCQLYMCSDFFLNKSVRDTHNIKTMFSILFFEYDKKYKSDAPQLDYAIFDDLNILVIEINSLDNEASSDKIITYCENKNIRVIRTFLVKFPIYPINWSGYGERKIDYTDWKGLDVIDYNRRFEECMTSLENSNKSSDLSMEISSFIKDNFNKQLLFTHSLHPTNIVLYEIWRHIFKQLSINIEDYEYKFEGELINCWFNPFTSKMVKDLNILFSPVISDIFYIRRYHKYISQYTCNPV